MNNFKLKLRKGIDDLRPLYAFKSNDGGGGVSNSIESYQNSGGWMTFVFDCELTQEAIANQIARNAQYNMNYLSKLFKSNTFGEEYTVEMFIQSSEVFDKATALDPGNGLASYKMVFLNLKTDD